MPDIDHVLIETAVVYLAKRQLQGRPTTLRQLGKRMAMSASRVLDAVEGVGVHYVLVPYDDLRGRNQRGVSNTEVLIQEVPENYCRILGIESQEIVASFTEILGPNPQPVDEFVEAQEFDALVGETLDPFASYRISKDKYEVLKKHLITFEELVQVAKENGFSITAIRKATGGDRMRYPLPSPFWRPFVLGKKRFYLKDVIDHLAESDRTYKSRGRLESKRRERIGDPETNKFIQFDRRKKAKKATSRKKVFG